MVTPFLPDGSVDLEGVAKVAQYLIDNGNDGLVVSGTTGEAPTTTAAEDGEILAAVVDAVGERAQVVAGVGTNSTETSVELASQAAKVGADAIMLVTPYYNKPAQRGLITHFQQVIDAADLPTMMYDIPGRTGTEISLGVYEVLRQDERVVAIKDAVGDLARAAKLVRMGYAVYSGDDGAILGFLAHGGCGLVSVSAHAIGPQLANLIATFNDNNPSGALEQYHAVVPVIEAIMGVPNYGATTAKAALELLGVLDNRRVRSPLPALDEAEVASLRAAFVAADLIADSVEVSE